MLFFPPVDILKCIFKISVSHFNVGKEIMSTQLKYLVNQITFSIINDDARALGWSPWEQHETGHSTAWLLPP